MTVKPFRLLIAALLGAAASAPALAADLNPQPLPPGQHAPHPPPAKADAARFEPPDPCRTVQARRADARCAARHGDAHKSPGRNK
jgi:hypothetical protein